MSSISSEKQIGLGLRAILLVIFDQKKGPIISCSDPPGAVGDFFNALHPYLVPESYATGRVLSVVLDDNVILGAPIFIDDPSYDRNCFSFNVCVVINSQVDSAPHRDLAQNLATAFHTLEVELKLLSNLHSQEKVAWVQSMLEELREQLNTSEECFVRVGRSHCISFRVRRRSMALDPEPLRFSSKLPLPLVDLIDALWCPSPEAKNYSDFAHLPYEPDPVLLHLASFIDGVRTVQEIIEASGVDQERVFLCLRHLMHFRFVAAIDPIREESKYCLTPAFHRAFEKQEVITEVVPYVTEGQSTNHTELVVEVVQALFARIDGWRQTLGEFRKIHHAEFEEHNISWRRFITFGLLHGFLEPIDVYAQSDHLSDEMRELQTLRGGGIRAKKQELQRKGVPINQINKHPEVQGLVARMNELRWQLQNGKDQSSNVNCG
eukprot:TRINITY_DN17674_c0_g1_i1.p1 TRINITY_DN17674_c0_g1~~TRINITY_DN17674_c0_g1_i1.p1  ORF type:complete len:435 (+),score=72.68 TRINITY_DN17674_c0_g1_i1:168-1472(+)